MSGNQTNPNINTSANLMDDLLANPFGEQEIVAGSTTQEAKTVKLIDVIPEENREKAYQLAEQINPKDHQAMLSYGTPAQSKLANILTFHAGSCTEERYR